MALFYKKKRDYTQKKENSFFDQVKKAIVQTMGRTSTECTNEGKFFDREADTHVVISRVFTKKLIRLLWFFGFIIAGICTSSFITLYHVLKQEEIDNGLVEVIFDAMTKPFNSIFALAVMAIVIWYFGVVLLKNKK